MLRAAFLSLFFIALGAQDAQAPRAGQAKPAQPKQLKGKQKNEPSAENKIIGRVGKTVYRESDFFDYLPLTMRAADVERVKNTPEMQKQAQKRFMENMLLAAKAQKDGLDKTPDFKTKLAGVTKTLLIQEIISKKGPELESLSAPTEDQIKAFYEENINRFKTPESASARHILVNVRGSESETDKPTDEEALARIFEAKKEILGGRSWDEVARKYSDDPGSKEKGGLYENFRPAQMVPQFAEAVRTQETGVIGEPVRTQFGYHLILVESFTPERAQTFDEAKGAVQRQLGDKMMTETWNSFIGSLKDELGFEENDDAAIPANSEHGGDKK